MNKHEIIEQELCKEIDRIENGIKSGQSMSFDDLKKLDLMFHTLKDISTYKAMKESEEYKGMSGMRGNEGRSYEDGYSQGYSQAMEQMKSSHMPYYPEPRRW